MDGIGDYTACLAVELSKSASVSVLTTPGNRTPIPGVMIKPVFALEPPRSVERITRCIEEDKPDWVLLQYQPFSYGRWGLNLHLPLAIHRIKRRCPGTRFALMVHEPFVNASSLKNAIMTIWQRWQLWMLGRCAEAIFFTIEAWYRRFGSWFTKSVVGHLPVGSNVPYLTMNRQAAKAHLHVEPDTLLCGFFGTAHQARMLDWVTQGIIAARQTGQNAKLLYIGRDGQTIRAAMGSVPMLDQGVLTPVAVSHCFTAMDIYFAPFTDGISTRRTSLMTALQHGIATVGTCGELTDSMLSAADGRALLLADVKCPNKFNDHVVSLAHDCAWREEIGHAGQALYQQNFSWEHITAKLLAVLTRSPVR